MPPRLTGSDDALPISQATSAPSRGSSQDFLAEEVVGLFDQFRAPLLRYLASLGLALPDGEEVLQETFLSLFQHLRRGKSRENLRGWLFRVAHNLSLKRSCQARRDLRARLEAGIEDIALDTGLNPEDQLADTQEQKRVQAVVRALPEQDRRCLFLRAEGTRYREIAAILDMSLGAVSHSLTRSLGRIARAAKR
jgi:RNA polymerase sigma-70 factor (ECF subfamily)